MECAGRKKQQKFCGNYAENSYLISLCLNKFSLIYLLHPHFSPAPKQFLETPISHIIFVMFIVIFRPHNVRAVGRGCAAAA